MREPGGRAGDRLAMLVSFSSFFVFPAIPVGRTGAITIPLVLAAGLTLLWLPRLRTSDWWPLALLVVPTVLSAAYVLIAGRALVPLAAPKSVVAMAMSMLVLVPALRLMREGHGEGFVLGAAYAILVHAALGAYQVLAFERLEFPFAGLMRTNPAQALLAEDPATYAEWVKRPFGLFAEPSAMAACVGPWLVVITGALFSPAGRLRPFQRAVLAVALASGLWLVVVSRSGVAAFVVAGTAMAALAAAFARRRSIGARAAALTMGTLIALASTVWLSRNVGSRFDLGENESWRARRDSLELGTRALAAPDTETGMTLLTGVGPGQSFTAVNTTQLKYQVGADVTAVWSVGLNYALENGVPAMAALLILSGYAAWSIWRSRQRVAGLAFGLVWLTGVFVATSYVGQPALWTGLAALLSWRSVAT